ncbi:hypothetical protein ACLOJK_008805 [Asimina triloba]
MLPLTLIISGARDPEIACKKISCTSFKDVCSVSSSSMTTSSSPFASQILLVIIAGLEEWCCCFFPPAEEKNFFSNLLLTLVGAVMYYELHIVELNRWLLIRL